VAELETASLLTHSATVPFTFGHSSR